MSHLHLDIKPSPNKRCPNGFRSESHRSSIRGSTILPFPIPSGNMVLQTMQPHQRCTRQPRTTPVQPRYVETVDVQTGLPVVVDIESLGNLPGTMELCPSNRGGCLTP
ncbi:hypothetical protein JTE90_019076 [Oedothorax gibbosus]|uniref:Protein Wnt n=1 Tax=Oedothorax gibbosus TaxID=931172 RepID=A0AAV6TLP9_9ARAC|nr:hypothetical protein JTE90_019076 [Oedothorax gibbosus]